jgi:cellobiose-specific phosphotransferase system component IIC
MNATTTAQDVAGITATYIVSIVVIALLVFLCFIGIKRTSCIYACTQWIRLKCCDRNNVKLAQEMNDILS